MKKLSASSIRTIRIALFASILVSAAAAPAHAIPFAHGLSVFTAAVERAKAPNGWATFCARYPAECAKPGKVQKMALIAMASALPEVRWDGRNESLPLINQWSSIWAPERDSADSIKVGYWDALLDGSSWMGPKAGSSFPVMGDGSAHVAASEAPRKIELSADNWEKLVAVNTRVNRGIKPVPDMQHFGRVNVWVYPTDGKGDCKAYALVKQRQLIQAGFPREALLITIVWTRENQGHAVLMARTNKGDYILDNLSPKVSLWTETTHDYVKRQSVSNPNDWVYIDGYRNPKQKMQVVAGISEE